MNWNKLFGKVQTITPEQTKRLMDSESLENYQLLDVRQPKEYEQNHLPGALLIPLSDLTFKLSSLNKNKTVIVYCRSGARSKAACQILVQAGFEDCFNMSGGMLKWNGGEAAGGDGFGLEYFINGEFSSSFSMAYMMESNLKQFYLHLSEEFPDSAEKQMLNQMALFEDGHMARLLKKYKDQSDSAPHMDAAKDIIEGGVDTVDLRSALSGQLDSAENVLQLAMKLEAQALDLYTRLAREHQQSDVASFFNEMAHEEQTHLQRLSKQLDKLLEN